MIWNFCQNLADLANQNEGREIFKMGEIFKFYVEYPYFELLLAIIENASQQVEIGLCFQQIVVFVHRY